MPSPYSQWLSSIPRWLWMALLLSITLPVPVHADFSKNYGTASQETRIMATAVADGYTYIAGFFQGSTLTVGSTTLTKIGFTDGFVAKLDAAGDTVWAKNFGGSGMEAYTTTVAVDTSGNVFVSGSFGGTSSSMTTPSLEKICMTTVGGSCETAFVLMLNSSGDFQWQQAFGGTNATMFPKGIAVYGSSAYLIGIFALNNLTKPALTKIGTNDVFVLKMRTSDGESSPASGGWAKNFGGGNNIGVGIAADGTSVYISGYLSANPGFTIPNLPRKGIGTFDAFVFKLAASDGAITWAQSYGGPALSFEPPTTAGKISGLGIVVDTNGDIYMSGKLDDSIMTPPLTKIAGAGNADAVVLKLSGTDGTVLWAKNFGGATSYTVGAGIALDTSGNPYLAGYMTGNLTTPVLTKIGTRDVFVLKLRGSDGSIALADGGWAKNYGGAGATAEMAGSDPSYDLVSPIAVDAAGKVYLAGWFSGGNLTTPALTKIGTKDGFIIQGTPVVPLSVVSIAPSGSPAANATSVDFTVTFSEAVTDVDTSDFTLTKTATANGSIGTVSGSGTTWTVPITGISGAGTIRLDLNASGTGIKNGSNEDISGGFTTGTVHTVDRIAPTISSVTGPTDGYYRAGVIMSGPIALAFTVTYDESVTVTNTPRIPLTIGSSTVYATYTSGSPGTALTFGYIVQAGDNDDDGIAASSPIDLNSSGTIRDAAGNDATLTFTPPTLTGVIVDTTLPDKHATTPITVNDADTSNSYTESDTLTLTFSEPVRMGPPMTPPTVSGGHTLGTGATIVAQAPSDGFTASFVITLGGSPSLVAGDTLTFTAGNIADRAYNSPSANVVFTVPDFNAAPVASNVQTDSGGTTNPGQTLTGSYDYNDAESDPQSGTTFRWLRNTTNTTTGASALGGATSATYVVTLADRDKYLFYCVTPAASSGTSPGAEACSSGVQVSNNAVTLTVTTLDDPDTVGGCISDPTTDCSLRDAIATASSTVMDTIDFAVALQGGTITLATGLTISKRLKIDGGDRQITVSGDNAVRVFEVNASNNETVILEKLTVADGYVDADANPNPVEGGGIRNGNNSILGLFNVTVARNSAVHGGGLYQASGGMSIIANSLFVENTATSQGGGISSQGTILLVNSTLVNNSANSGGGGFWVSPSGPPTALINTTISGNTGYGIVNVGNPTNVTLKNTLLAGNTGGNCSGGVVDGGNNLDDGASCNFSTNNQSLSSTDPLLGTLGNYGGLTQTIPLLPGSPAIGAGDATTCADTTQGASNVDQRGVTRPQGTVCDIGAFEWVPVGACGSANSVAVSTTPTTNLCSAGTASSVSGSGPWTWTCTGSTTANCSAPLAGGGGGGGGVTPISGLCGSANGQTFTSAPSSNLCTLGSASTVSGSGPWTWGCAGSNGGSDASCSANLQVQSYTVTGTAGTGWTISPPTQTVNHGATTTLTVTANSGYRIDTVTGCGGMLSGTTYTTGAITAACTVSVTVVAAPTLTPATQTVSGSIGSPITATTAYTATGFTGAVTYSISPALPAGLSLNVSTGVISGTPTAPQTATIHTVTGTGVTSGTATATISVTVMNALEPVTLTTPALPNAVIGIPYAVTLGASGGEPPYNYTVTGLPPGLTLSTEGVLSGTPLQAGARTITITVTDALGQTDQRAYPLTVETDLAVATPHLIDGIVGAAYGQTLSAIGGVLPYTWSLLSGVLPDGLTLDSSSGLLSGVPTTADTSTFTVRVTDADGQTATQALTLTIQAPSFTRPDPGNPTQPPVSAALKMNPAAGKSCAFNDQNSFTLNLGEHGVPVTPPSGVTFPHGLLQIEVEGCTPGETTVTVTVVYPRTLPPGVKFWKYGKTLANPTDHWYVLDGAVIAGNTVTYTIRDGGLGDDDLTANGRIIDPAGPAIPDFALTGQLPTTGQAGVAYEGALTAHNGIGPYTWSVAAGTLPDGLGLVEVAPDEPTAFLSGTPTQAGDYAFTLQVVDEGQGNLTAQQAFTLTITPQPTAVCPYGLGPDTDGDGVPNAVETAQGTNPQVKDNDVFEQPAAFVAQLYRDLLYREPEPSGLTYWQNQLQAGLSRGGIINGLYQFPEFQNGVGAIARLYQAAFNRTADACGLAFWVEQGQAGRPLDDIAAFFVVSGEFLDLGVTDPQDFVTRLYENVLGRAPDAEGRAFWQGQLNAGATWGAVLLGFTQSPEYRAALESRVTADLYYLGFLNRDPDVGGYAFWVNDLDQTTDPAPVHEAVQAMPEYHYRVLGTLGVTRR